MEIDICRRADRSIIGPAVPSGCRGGFDFTFFFQDLFFGLFPAIALLLAVPIRLWNLRVAGVGVRGSLGLSKQVSRADRVCHYHENATLIQRSVQQQYLPSPNWLHSSYGASNLRYNIGCQ